MRGRDEQGVDAHPGHGRLLPVEQRDAADGGREDDEDAQRQALLMVTSLCIHTLAPIIGVVDHEVTPYVR